MSLQKKIKKLKNLPTPKQQSEDTRHREKAQSPNVV